MKELSSTNKTNNEINITRTSLYEAWLDAQLCIRETEFKKPKLNKKQGIEKRSSEYCIDNKTKYCSIDLFSVLFAYRDIASKEQDIEIIHCKVNVTWLIYCWHIKRPFKS